MSPHLVTRIGLTALAASVTLSAQVLGQRIDDAPPVLQDLAEDPPLGTAPTGDSTIAGIIDLGEIFPGDDDRGERKVYENTRFAANGCSLRNARMSGINVVGCPAGSVVVRAFLYWGWASLAAPTPGVHDVIRIKRRHPGNTFFSPVIGTLVGAGADPCWLGASNFVYCADVTAQAPGVVTGGGMYIVKLRVGAAGAVDYSDPWGAPGPVGPLAEGAALVVVYQNAIEPMGVTSIYDFGLAGNMFLTFPGLTYSLSVPIPAAVEARWCNIGMDGQSGAGYVDTLEVGHDTTFELLTGTPLAGGGPFGLPSAYNDSDYNGSANKPLGQLFDVSGHDVTPFALGAPIFPLLFTSPGAGISDCLVPVANVFWTR